MINLKRYFIKYKVSNSDKKLLLKNLFFILVLRIFIIIYTIVRIILINRYIGVENYGLLNIMISIAPLALVLINGTQSKSMYALYKFSLKKKYDQLNIIIAQQVKEMRYYSLISWLFVLFLMLISYFFFSSPGLNGYIAALLVLANSIEFLSFGIIVPITYWYLNSIYKNYIYDIFSIFFSTVANILSFIIIYLYGTHIISFLDVSYATGSTYVVLITSILLSFRYFLSNAVLNIFKKKYMSWYKRKKIKYNIFNKNSTGYIFHQFLGNIVGLILPVCFFIFSLFYINMTTISGIYYSYYTFITPISFLTFIISSLRPYIARIFFKNDNNFESKETLLLVNKLLFKLLFIIILILQFNYVLLSPYLVLLTKSYFNFVIPFLLSFNIVMASLKSINEDFIYVHGKPEKYFILPLYELFFALIIFTCGFLCFYMTGYLSDNLLNILIILLICDFLTKTSKFVLNTIYVNKNIFDINFVKYLSLYWSYFLFFIIYIIGIALILKYEYFFINQQFLLSKNEIVTTKNDIITSLNFNYNEISWKNVICLIVFSNLIFIPLILLYFYFLDNDEYKFVKKMLVDSLRIGKI